MLSSRRRFFAIGPAAGAFPIEYSTDALTCPLWLPSDSMKPTLSFPRDPHSRQLMNRNWTHIEGYLNRLARDVYPEPVTSNHKEFTHKSFHRFVLPQKDNIAVALDVGCGQGPALELFKQHGIAAI